MSKRFLYGAGVVLLVILMALVVWQVSFKEGLEEMGPADLTQTFIFWAVSTLVFVLTITLGFILFRDGVKLYVERQKGREGSRIQSRLFFGALALSFMPVVFLVFFSYAVLNRTLDKWFTGPAEAVQKDYLQIGDSLRSELTENLVLKARLVATMPEVRAALSGDAPVPDDLMARFRRENNLLAATLNPDAAALPKATDDTIALRYPIDLGGGKKGIIGLAAKVPLDLSEARARIETQTRRMGELSDTRKHLRAFYILMQSLLALFTLFFATWIARFYARQISTPISALLRAADEVGDGNLSYRVDVRAIDELAGLVRGFNQMTAQLESNSRELDARRRFTEAILESIPTGVISLSGDGTILRVNRALNNVFPEEQVAKAHRLEDLFSREDAADIKYLMKRARRTSVAGRELELRTANQTLHLAITVSALDENLTSGFVVVLEDLSDLLRAQKFAAWHEVARRVAHEIKNPLTPIALSAERIGRQIERLHLPADTERILRECTSTIASEVESVKTLVDEFAQFARFPAAQPVRTDLNEVVENAMAVFQGRLDGIRIEMRLASNLPPVNLDREQFKRVVVNLVDNAAEAMLDAPVKELSLLTRAGAADSVELVIADTGCGVSAEDKEKLFLPYFSTKGRGTGLGLAIVNHILSDHGAKIRVDDNPPSGARFTIEIPALVELTEDTTLPAAAPAGAATS
jgi:two-component system, NtrC family, nitrogen regulation sensor histidine kinase NtrY